MGPTTQPNKDFCPDLYECHSFSLLLLPFLLPCLAGPLLGSQAAYSFLFSASSASRMQPLGHSFPCSPIQLTGVWLIAASANGKMLYGQVCVL